MSDTISVMLSNLGALLLATLLLMFAPLSFAQDAKTVAPAPVSNHFHSDTLHLSFDVPDDIEVRPELIKKVNEDLKQKKKTPTGQPCVTLPMIGFNPTILRRLYFYQSDTTCFPDGLTQDRLRLGAFGMLRAILQNMGKPSVASPIDYDLDGKSAVVVSGSVFSEKNKGLVFGEVGCVLLDGYSACWVFISSNADKVAHLAEMPVRFDDRQPVPVIPPDASALAVPSSVTYHDDAHHFTFTYPGSFVDAHQRTADILAKKVDEANDKEKPVLGCVRTPFTGEELTDTTRSSILIFNIDEECQKLKISKSTLPDFAKGMAKGLAKAAKKSDLQKPITYSLSGHDAVLVQAKLTSATGTDSSVLEACTIISEDVFCWQFGSTSLERLHQIATSEVAFDGKLAVPVVPSELLKEK